MTENTCCNPDKKPDQSTSVDTESPCASKPISSCCAPAQSQDNPGGCCDDDPQKFDGLLWGSALIVFLGCALHFTSLVVDVSFIPPWLYHFGHGTYDLMSVMWWGMLLGIIFVGILARIPQAMITFVLGRGGTFNGIVRATAAGVLFDLCSHGILMVGMQLYQRGASIGQVMAFLIASPWNSLSLTIILIALIGLPWTLVFIAGSVVIAIISGFIFDHLVSSGRLPPNPVAQTADENYRFFSEFKHLLKNADWSFRSFRQLVSDGLKGSKTVIRWLFIGIVLAVLIRTFISLDNFQDWFGPTAMGLVLTILAATVIEVCSEGSAPIGADLMNRAQAPGNSFAFMMAGVSTDYTEVMVIRDTTRSWKMALFLPLITLPQIIVIAVVLNQFS